MTETSETNSGSVREAQDRGEEIPDPLFDPMKSLNMQPEALQTLPYIVIVIDEFADLILTKQGKEIETSVCRLAAKARAAGIHIVLATQRPSVDVITGLIKNNFPTRVSFRVTSNMDSKTILTATGAEKLLGMGDMLYKHGVEMNRVHSAYVGEEEVDLLCEKLEGIPQDYNAAAMEFLENQEKIVYM